MSKFKNVRDFILKNITTEIAGIKLNYVTLSISDLDTRNEFNMHRKAF